jgi:xanthine/CO dehydrogenase XdhC/CoxF family maturation factor
VRLAEARLLRSVVDVEGCHAAVVMSHHLNSDAEYLRELAEVPNPAYMGLLGPMARRNRLAKEMGPAADNPLPTPHEHVTTPCASLASGW